MWDHNLQDRNPEARSGSSENWGGLVLGGSCNSRSRAERKGKWGQERATHRHWSQKHWPKGEMGTYHGGEACPQVLTAVAKAGKIGVQTEEVWQSGNYLGALPVLGVETKLQTGTAERSWDLLWDGPRGLRGPFTWEAGGSQTPCFTRRREGKSAHSTSKTKTTSP